MTYNSARYIDGLLASVPASAEDLSLRIIVVDNASLDDTVARVSAHRNVICVEAGANLGYSGGINVGRRHVGECGAVAVLNPDLILEPGSLHALFSALDEPSVGIAVPMLLDFGGNIDQSLRREPTLLSELGDALFGHHFQLRPAWASDVVRSEREYAYSHPVDWANGAAILISRECDRKVGDWDEAYFLYMEEVDFAARVRDAGFQVMYVPQARVRHLGGGSSQSPKLEALKAVSRVRYFEKRGRHPRILRGIVFLNQLLRSSKSVRRAALWAVANRSTWEPLIAGLKDRNSRTYLETVSRLSPSSRDWGQL